jgi:hypothetical protein
MGKSLMYVVGCKFDDELEAPKTKRWLDILCRRKAGTPKHNREHIPDKAPAKPPATLLWSFSEKPSGCPVSERHRCCKAEDYLSVRRKKHGGAKEEGMDSMGCKGGV